MCLLACLLVQWLLQETVAAPPPPQLARRRVKRRELCEYLSAMIRNCSAAEEDAEETCDKAVQAALHFHDKSKSENGGVCLMGKYHNVLYIAARLAFLFRLRNSRTVCRLLRTIFACEGTFERIVTGAIFGPRLCGAFSGWKSEFDSREECLEALRYFLERAVEGRLEVAAGRLADVPLLTATLAPPATLALQVGRADVFRLLVEYGADVHHTFQGMVPPMEVMKRIRDGKMDMNEECLILGRELHLGGDGWPLPSLKQLARHKVRECLNQNFQLPNGVAELPLPLELIAYIRFDRDSSGSY